VTGVGWKSSWSNRSEVSSQGSMTELTVAVLKVHSLGSDCTHNRSWSVGFDAAVFVTVVLVVVGAVVAQHRLQRICCVRVATLPWLVCSGDTESLLSSAVTVLVYCHWCSL